MSNTKHSVTVHVPMTAEISVEQIERYMMRLGWQKADYRCPIYEHPTGGKLRLYEPLERVVLKLAEIEDRQAGDVLADIAREPAP